MERKIGLIYLAGGKGLRFGTDIPKQYLQLDGKPLALHAFESFQQCSEIEEFVVICEPEFRALFSKNALRPIVFALPGKRRQDSVENGFRVLSSDVGIVAVHDAVRPFSTGKMIMDVANAAETYGAATTGMPVKFTLKECDPDGFAVHTPDRSRYWEIQTPQAVRYEILEKGFHKAMEEGLTVTDDTSLAELIGAKVKVVQGAYNNIKVTTPEDLVIAEQMRAAADVYL